MSVTKQRSPRVRCTDAGLKRVGVKLVNQDTGWLQCERCGTKWSPDIQPGGRMHKRWWWCPEHYCNVPEEMRMRDCEPASDVAG